KYYESGEIAERCAYHQGKRQGNRVLYYPTGQKSAQYSYNNDFLDGEAQEWHPNGQKKSVLFYCRGLLNGSRQHRAFTRYTEKGIVTEVQDFCQGQPTGNHLIYDENGKEIYRATFVLGQKQGLEKCFSSEGALIQQGEYVNGKPIGKHAKY